MNTVEQDALQKLKTALTLLPENKRDYIMGYAEGVLAMSEQRHEEQERASA